jgi:hypothetical protein
MKIRILFALGLGLATASQSWAIGPIGPVRLGGLDALLTFCGQINPSGVSTYNAYRASLVSDQTVAQLEAAALTGGYKKAYAEVGGALSAARRDWAVQTCLNLMSPPAI